MGETRDVTWSKTPPRSEGAYWFRATEGGVWAVNVYAEGRTFIDQNGDNVRGYQGEWWPLPLHPPAETEQKHGS